MSNILIIKHGSLGDIAQACGAIQDISENHKEDKIYLVKITGTNKNSFNKTDEKYLKFVDSQNTNNRKSFYWKE